MLGFDDASTGPNGVDCREVIHSGSEDHPDVVSRNEQSVFPSGLQAGDGAARICRSGHRKKLRVELRIFRGRRQRKGCARTSRLVCRRGRNEKCLERDGKTEKRREDAEKSRGAVAPHTPLANTREPPR